MGWGKLSVTGAENYLKTVLASKRKQIHHLLVIEDNQGKRTVALEAATCSVGRDSSNSVVLHSNLVSRQHALLLRVNAPETTTYFRIIDGNFQGKLSTNGLVINGQQCYSHNLKHGDVILFSGDVRARYYTSSNLSDVELLNSREAEDISGFLSNLSNPFQTLVTSTRELENVSEAALVRLASFPELISHPILEIDLTGTITYINPAASVQFPDIQEAQLQHPILSGVISTVQNKQEKFFIREVEVGSAVFEQSVHYIAESDLIRSYVVDITKRKQVETRLQQAHEELETRVAERTADLSKANEQLQSEIIERRRAEQELQKREASIRAVYELTFARKLTRNPTFNQRLHRRSGMSTVAAQSDPHDPDYSAGERPARDPHVGSLDYPDPEWGGLSTQPLILVVDDEKSMRILLSKAMEKAGYQVAEAKDGEECLAVYDRLQPDLILLDAMMPVMDGFTCCNQLQKLPRGDRIPVLMITGLDDQASVDRAFEVGATDYITKPINWAVLRQRVRRLLDQSQLYRQLEEANQGLQHLASSDSLTQIANRRRFDEYLDQEWRRMAREAAPLSLIMCDVDFFKRYNDTYGHQAGDACLQQVARAISCAVNRPADLAARYGGEEFAVILPNTEAEGAAQIAEAIRAEVKALEIAHTNSQVSNHLTLSLGVASTVPSPESSPAALIAAADWALYQSKAEGRDRVIQDILNVTKVVCDFSQTPSFPNLPC